MPPVTPIGTPLIQLDQVDSSNNYAMGQVQALLAEHGTTWLAKHQTSGKGQRGKSWDAPWGENLIMSTVINPGGLPVTEQFYLSVAISLGCYDFLMAHTKDDARIKWPNDLYWKDRKAGGMLIENILQGGEWKFAIIGIGININQTVFNPSLPNPVSLKQVTGKTFDLPSIAIELCGFLEKRWQQVKSKKWNQLLEAYNAILYKKNELVSFKYKNVEITARVIGVNENGELMIDTGTTTTIPFGEVEWIIP